MPPSKEDQHALVDRLFPLSPPKNEHVAETMDATRAAFMEIAHDFVTMTPVCPDQTIAIRAIHSACQACIGAIATNQELYP